MCDTCREMAILSGALWRQESYKAQVIEDMINHILNGHTAQSTLNKFGFK